MVEVVVRGRHLLGVQREEDRAVDSSEVRKVRPDVREDGE